MYVKRNGEWIEIHMGTMEKLRSIEYDKKVWK